jgi:hemolysin activation/secretion protein
MSVSMKTYAPAYTRLVSILGATALLTIASASSYAQSVTIPGSASGERVKPARPLSVIDTNPNTKIVVPQQDQSAAAPQGAKEINFVLKNVVVSGSTAFSEEKLKTLYQPYLGKNITLDIVWVIADKITALYREEGYFLSRAYVPAQEIDTGSIRINVIEGYVGSIEGGTVPEDTALERSIIEALKKDITSQRPLKTKELEEFVLRMNDLPGRKYRTVLKASAPNNAVKTDENAIDLALIQSEAKGTGIVTADNFSSRYLGPYTASVSYRDSFIKGQDTGITLGSSIPMQELGYIALDQSIPFTPKLFLEVNATHVNAKPGYTLKPNEIESKSNDLGVNVAYKIIRQWDENLSLRLGINGKNVNGDILSTALTRDRIRTAQAKVDYDFNDRWGGYNSMNFKLRRGLRIMGASREGELNLSRGEATPDFTTGGFEVIHQHALPKQYIATVKAAGQIASDPLFSAEEFGYGAQNYGRAYDSSEIIGDNGIAGSIEMAYAGLRPMAQGKVNVVPYVFYDIGKVWNKDTGSKPDSASSAGLGMRVMHQSGLSGQIGIAQPLTRDVDTPLYGGNGKNPRLLMQVSYQF